MITELQALLDAALGGRAAVYAEDTGPDGTRPAVWITRSGLTYTARALPGAARLRAVTLSAVCVASSAVGASHLSSDVANAVDGSRVTGQIARVILVTPVIEDTTDPTMYRWSATVEISLITPR